MNCSPPDDDDWESHVHVIVKCGKSTNGLPLSFRLSCISETLVQD